MKLGISTHLFALWPLEPRHLELIRSGGFDGVEIWAMAPHVEIETPGSLARSGRWAARAGLTVHSVHLPFYRRFGAPNFRYLNIGDPDRGARDEALRLARAALAEIPATGAPIAVLHGPTQHDAPDEILLRLFEEDLAVLAEEARALGVRLAIENVMTRLSTSDHLAGLLGRIEAGETGACLDLGHANINESALGAARNLSGRILTTHIQDNHGEHDEHLIPGKGVIDWPAVVSVLRDGGDPNLIIEIIGPALVEQTGLYPPFDEKAFLEHLHEARAAAKTLLGL